MKYSKKPLSYKEQAELLINRGLNVDVNYLVDILKKINYYRLTAYCIPFREINSENFREGTSIDDVLNFYYFDKDLREFIWQYITDIEIYFRTIISYEIARYNDNPFIYMNREFLRRLKNNEYDKFKQKILGEKERSKEVFVKHFNNKYGDKHNILPIWMAVEIMSFGDLVILYKGIEKRLGDNIAQTFLLKDKYILLSWMIALNEIRNICAHHSRLWNRERGYKIKIPKSLEEWKEYDIDDGKLFTILSVMKFILKRKKMKDELKNLFEKYNLTEEIIQEEMGFKDGWENLKIWCD